MKKAAAALEFERAAQLRDALEDMKRTVQKTEKFERVPYKLPVAINPESDLRELARILNLPAPPARIEGFDISNISGTFMVASMVSFWHARPDRANYRRFRMKTVTEQNDFACMAETIRRRYSRLLKEVRSGRPETGGGDDGGEASPPDLQRAVDDVSRVMRGGEVRVGTDAAAARVTSEFQAPDSDLAEASWVPKPSAKPNLPDLILIDGGKGQLNAACEELAKLGLSHIPIIGLAKENEEIHRPGERDPLILGLDHQAVKLLQRVRDESHRFANTYNAQLRLKKISESVLDEFPGIGDTRKQALLKRFGSLQRLRLARIEEIELVPGFGGTMASELKRFLEAREQRKPGAD